MEIIKVQADACALEMRDKAGKTWFSRSDIQKMRNNCARIVSPDDHAASHNALIGNEIRVQRSRMKSRRTWRRVTSPWYRRLRRSHITTVVSTRSMTVCTVLFLNEYGQLFPVFTRKSIIIKKYHMNK